MSLKSNVKGLIELLSPDLENVVFGKQISSSPKLPYASFSFISNTKLGRPSIRTETSTINPTTALTEIIETQRIANIGITFYSKTTSDLLEDITEGETVISKEAQEFSEEFTDSLEITDSLLFMANNKFSVLNYTDFLDVDSFLSDSWERRATIELQINHVTSISKEIPFISSSGGTITGIFPQSGNLLTESGEVLLTGEGEILLFSSTL